MTMKIAFRSVEAQMLGEAYFFDGALNAAYHGMRIGFYLAQVAEYACVVGAPLKEMPCTMKNG